MLVGDDCRSAEWDHVEVKRQGPHLVVGEDGERLLVCLVTRVIMAVYSERRSLICLQASARAVPETKQAEL